MKKRRSIFASALLIVVLALAWLTLAPRQLGGPLSYVITSGTSMEPRFHSGDLAIVREQSSYSPGDIVAYHNLQLRNILLHRILKVDGDHYVFKGDNNDFVDAFHPTQDQLVGKLWVRVPGGGNWLARARSPRGAGVLAGVVGLMVAGGISKPKRSGSDSAAKPRASSGSRHVAYKALPFIAALLVLFAIFGAIAYKRAPYAFARSNLKYTQSGKFAYSARTSPGPVYPGGRVVTGQPLFTKLVHKVTVSFDYSLRSSLTHDVTGTQSMRVGLLDTSGYSRLIQRVQPQQLSGDTGSVHATIDIGRLESLANKLERATGVPRSSDIVSVTPVTKVSGMLNGQQFSTSYSPSLNFQIDALEMRLVAANPTPGSVPSELIPSQASALPVLTKQQSHVDIAFIHMHVRTARFVAVAGAGLCLLLLLFVGIPLWRALNGDEATRIEVKHGALLVPLRSSWFTSSKTKVDVASIDSLVQIAYGYDKLILHAQDGGVHRYVVESDGVLFTYETSGRE